jgi:hypothetical protein
MIGDRFDSTPIRSVRCLLDEEADVLGFFSNSSAAKRDSIGFVRIEPSAHRSGNIADKPLTGDFKDRVQQQATDELTSSRRNCATISRVGILGISFRPILLAILCSPREANDLAIFLKAVADHCRISGSDAVRAWYPKFRGPLK